MFNESFATAVERLGGDEWLRTQASPAAREEYARYDQRRTQFRSLTAATRERLEAIYRNDTGAGREAEKQQVMQQFREAYAKLRATWPGDPARYRFYDQWVANANNAAFAAIAAYDQLVPGFEALFAREGRDWQKFYAAAGELAKLPKDERHRRLEALARG
jgi:predicted aminopeptidase